MQMEIEALKERHNHLENMVIDTRQEVRTEIRTLMSTQTESITSKILFCYDFRIL